MAASKPVSPRLADIVADGGTAGRAADLIDAVYDSRSPDLLKATMLPHHSRMRAQAVAEFGDRSKVPETPELDLADVEKAAGLDEGSVRAASVRGRDLSTAWVVYVATDAHGADYKGCYPLGDHGKSGKSKQHSSEAETFAESEIAKNLQRQAEASEDDAPLRASHTTRRSPSSEKDDDE